MDSVEDPFIPPIIIEAYGRHGAGVGANASRKPSLQANWATREALADFAGQCHRSPCPLVAMLAIADLSSYLFPAGMSLLVVILVRMAIRRHRYKRPGGTGSASWRARRAASAPLPSAHLGEHPVATEQQQHQVELYEILRDIRAEISTRIGLLQQHTLAGRQEVQRLEAAIERARQLGLSPVRDTLTALEEALEEAAGDDAGEQLDAALERISSTLVPSVRTDARASIWQLAEEGHSATAIAGRLELPLGDVELLLQFGPPGMPSPGPGKEE